MHCKFNEEMIILGMVCSICRESKVMERKRCIPYIIISRQGIHLETSTHQPADDQCGGQWSQMQLIYEYFVKLENKPIFVVYFINFGVGAGRNCV